MNKLKIREVLSGRYIVGKGIEIGALHNPLAVSTNTSVKYVDRMSKDELRKQYPELNGQNLVDVDIIDNGETLSTIMDSTQDFVIANHFLEHCQNPLLTIKNMLRVVKTGGVVYLAVPDKRYTFDIDRPVTKFEHIEKDYINGAESSTFAHFEEWVEYVDKIKDPKTKKDRIKFLIDMDYSIHFHVWTQNEILELLFKTQKLFAFEVETIEKNGGEVILVLSKSS